MSQINLKNIVFNYPEEPSFVLKLAELAIEKNSRVFIEGPSGSGKTTLLSLLTGLVHPQQGDIEVCGTNITSLNLVQMDQFRADHFGIIFQLFNLLDYLTVIENITLACEFSKSKKEKALKSSINLKEEAKKLCLELDIPIQLFDKTIKNLSIGQRQRVAIARALMGKPDIIIADEPTSALDDQRKEQFMRLLIQECEKYHSTLVFVSHDMSLKQYFKKIVTLG